MDTDIFSEILKIEDPINYIDELANTPKYIIFSSNDEFMSMDWSNIFYDKLKGEKHLIIIPNSEHSLLSGVLEANTAAGTFIRSIVSGNKVRPTFEHAYNPQTGALSVLIPMNQVQPTKVALRFAQTL